MGKNRGPKLSLALAARDSFKLIPMWSYRVVTGSSASFLVCTFMAWQYWVHRKRKRSRDEDISAYEQLVGNTPMIRLAKLSSLIKRDIFVKMESMNPGGTGKDRAALNMILRAEALGLLPPPLLCSKATGYTFKKDRNTSPDHLDNVIFDALHQSRTGGLVVEGTSGSTGISLATLSVSRGHGVVVVMPDDQAVEKQGVLITMGAAVYVVPTAAISSPKHYVNVARRVAERATTVWGVQAFFTNQFENPSNFQIHYDQTGPEILQQCPDLDAFVMSSGTGGTISGVGQYLKTARSTCRLILVDPPGSALFNKVMHGVAYASEQGERQLRRHRYDTIAEGIGLDRVTHNLALGVDLIDSAVRVSDQEAVDFAHWLLQNEGLWVGSSSAMNLVGAVRTAQEMREGSKIVTVVCDSGQRHLSRFWNREFCIEWGLEWPGGAPRIPICLQPLLC